MITKSSSFDFIRFAPVAQDDRLFWRFAQDDKQYSLD